MKILNNSAEFTKAARSVMKWFPKAANSQVNGYPKATEVDVFLRILKFFCAALRNPLIWLRGAFGDPFMMLSNPLQSLGFELENNRVFR